MSTISIQETQIRIAPAFYNGDFRLFDNTSALYSVGNVFARPDDIFEGSALTSTVSKFDFSNLLGYRLLVDFDLEVPYDASGTWFSLFNKTSGSYNRTIFSDSIASATGSGTSIASGIISTKILLFCLNLSAKNVEEVIAVLI